jgi:hypothetical protein
MQNFIDIANAIQLSVAPAFLLTGIGAILSVMANRLARIIDRFRVLNYEINNKNINRRKEIDLLKIRAYWNHWAIAFTTFSAFLICLVIASIFIATEVHFKLDKLIAVLFILAMSFLIFGLISFIREVSLSKNVIKY